MKVSIDGILGTARKINSQKELEETNLTRKKEDFKADSVSIGNRLTRRLDAIENEFREIQSSLTRNQIIRHGIEQLNTDIAKGGQDQQAILTNVTFEGRSVLRDFIGDTTTKTVLTKKLEDNAGLINSDIGRIKKLQIELDNIVASDLVGRDRLSKMMTNIESIFNRSNLADVENISSLRPDAVMRLIK